MFWSAAARVVVSVRPLCLPRTLIHDTSNFQRDAVSAGTVVLTLITACYTVTLLLMLLMAV